MSTTYSQRLRAALFAAIAVTIPAGYASAQAADQDPTYAGEASGDLQPAAETVEEAAAEPPMVAAPPANEDNAGEAGYDKGFYIKSADGTFSLKTQGRVQGRYTAEIAKGTGGRELTDSNFSISRARMTLGGHAFGKDIKYKFQTDFGKGFVALKDFYIDYKLSDTAMIRLGQWKRPFSRQQLTSSGRQALVDRAITDKYFGAGRDIGIAIQNNFDKSPDLEWAVGVFNGTGDKPVFSGDANADGDVTGKFSNVPGMFGPALVTRVGINRGGIKGYSEADLEGGPLRFGVAASALAQLDADDDNQSAVRAQLDYIVKANGMSSTGGVYVATAQEAPAAGGSDTGFADQAYDAVGFHVQFGYMLAPEHQGVVRFAMINADASTENQQELTVGYSLYKAAHNLKWQTDISLLASGEDATIGDAVLARSQLQLSF